MTLISVSNNALSGITALPASIPTGALTLLSTQTASASATISFTTGLDSTYDEYIFKFIDIHGTSDGTLFQFNGSLDSGSNYNVTKTSTYFRAYHDEADTATALAYEGTSDLAQGTSFQTIATDIGTDADQSCVGTLQLFNPSSTTYVKHFIGNTQNYHNADYSMQAFSAGYFNSTSAINAIQFKMASGNFDGVIKLYGVS